MKKQLLFVLVLVLALGVFAAACGGEESTTSTEETTATTAEATTTTIETGPIKVGHIVDLTGFESTVGIYFDEGLQFALEAAGNEVAGREIEVITEDSKSTTQGALDAVAKLVESDEVDIILGPTQTGQKIAVAEYCLEAGIPMLFYSPSTPVVFEEDNPWIVGSGGSTLQAATCMADYTYNTLGYRNVITITQDSDAAREFMDPFTADLEALGGTVVDQKWTALTATDFAPYLTDIESQGADAVAMWEPGPQAIAFFIAWHQAGLDGKIPVIGNYHGGSIDPWIPSAVAGSNPGAASALEGVVGPYAFSFDSDSPAWLAYREGWAATHDEIMPKDGATNCTVQAAQTLLTALEAVGGNTDPTVLRDALLATDIIGPQGPQYFAEGDQVATLDIYIMDIHQGDSLWDWIFTTIKTYEAVPPTGYTAD